VGIALFIAWMQIRGGGGGGGGEELSSMPATVFEGGGGRLAVELTTSQPAELRFSFEQWDDAEADSRMISGNEALAPGSYTRGVDVSPDTYIYLELGVPDATPGAEVSWNVSVDGRRVLSESDRLDEPLASGYAFFLQVEADDIAQMRSWR